MNPSIFHSLETLRAQVRERAALAYVPYSGRHVAAVLLLSDGTWIPGVRVESASFSLVIPALINAYTTAVALGRTDLVALVVSRPFLPEEAMILQALDTPLRPTADDAFTVPGIALPAAGEALSPYLDDPQPVTPLEGVALARRVATRALVPESRFPVGCVARVTGGRLVPGVNVEHPDWSRILCAERNALGTVVSYGLRPVDTLYLSCPGDQACSPCGACRQLLVELAPSAVLWMDRGSEPPIEVSPEALLPGAFSGSTLPRLR